MYDEMAGAPSALAAKKELTELLHLLEQLSQEEKQQLICTAKKMLEEEKQGAN